MYRRLDGELQRAFSPGYYACAHNDPCLGFYDSGLIPAFQAV